MRYNLRKIVRHFLNLTRKIAKKMQKIRIEIPHENSCEIAQANMYTWKRTNEVHSIIANCVNMLFGLK